MKTVRLNLIKIGRAWIECKTESGYTCKLKIDDNSKDLQVGEKELLVKDISIRSKYGTDLRFELISSVENSERVFVKHYLYNCVLVQMCKDLGGTWDKESASWVFSKIVEEKVEEIELLFNSNLVSVEIEAKKIIIGSKSAVDFCGYTVARATGRDSGAFLGEEIYQLHGKVNSGGSMKNWYTEISKGSVFRLKVPENLLTAWIKTEEILWEVNKK